MGPRNNGDLRPMRTIISSIRHKLGDDADNRNTFSLSPASGYRMAKGEAPKKAIASA